jgi:hypothetical protein
MSRATNGVTNATVLSKTTGRIQDIFYNNIIRVIVTIRANGGAVRVADTTIFIYIVAIMCSNNDLRSMGLPAS